MKTLLTLVALLVVVWFGYAPAAQKFRNAAGAAMASVRETIAHPPQSAAAQQSAHARATPDVLRKFELTLESVRPGGYAVATGCYYDIPPTVTTSPEQLSASEGKPTAATHIFISGLPNGLVDDQTWVGWLIPDGTKTYNDTHTGFHTVPAYRLALPPPTVQYKAKHGSWMTEVGRTALDQRAH